MKAAIVSPTKTSWTGFERSWTSRSGSEPSKRPLHSAIMEQLRYRPVRQSVVMSDNSEPVTALIKQLLILNRVESTPTIESPVGEELEGRQAKRRRIRQELVRVLRLRDRKTL